MKKISFCLVVLLSISYMTSCAILVRHTDPFYNYNDNDFPRNHLPLINPYEASRLRSSSPWNMSLSPYGPWVSDYAYSRIEKLEKIAVKNGVIMAYSAYVDTEAPNYIQDNYYHWFILIPDKEIAEGFYTEDEFNQYIQALGIQDPDWQTPDEAYKKFAETGCLEWIPDCNQ